MNAQPTQTHRQADRDEYEATIAAHGLLTGVALSVPIWVGIVSFVLWLTS
jgi:hypothetical protein